MTLPSKQIIWIEYHINNIHCVSHLIMAGISRTIQFVNSTNQLLEHLVYVPDIYLMGKHNQIFQCHLVQLIIADWISLTFELSAKQNRFWKAKWYIEGKNGYATSKRWEPDGQWHMEKRSTTYIRRVPDEIELPKRRQVTRGNVNVSVYRLPLRHFDLYQISYH